MLLVAFKEEVVKILISGSTRYEGSNNKKNNFVKACEAIGFSLARAGHSIIVGSEKEDTADLYVVKGFCSFEGNKKKVLVYRPEEGETPYYEIKENSKRVDFEYRRSKGHWAVNRVNQILAADGVVLIGGGDGTLQAGYVAPVLGRPVLAIPYFGGAAEKVWRTIESDYKSIKELSTRVSTLKEKWENGNEEIVVNLIESLVKNNPYCTGSCWPQVFFSGLMLLFFFIWVLLLNFPVYTNLLNFFLLLAVSSFLGSGLRRALLLYKNNDNIILWKQILNEMTASLLLGFGLALMYLCGGLTITGKLEFINLSVGADFLRIAVSMSVLGFAAGYLVEEATERLSKLLVRSISSNEKKTEV